MYLSYSRANQWTGFYMIGTCVMKELMLITHDLKHELGEYLAKNTAQKIIFSIIDFFSKCDQIAENCRFGHIYWRNP